MTKKEALEALKLEGGLEITGNARRVAKFFEGLAVAEEAIEKQIPKRPTYEGDGYAPDGSFVWDEWLCPNCNSRFELDYDEHDYCPNCGQHIDWEKPTS